MDLNLLTQEVQFIDLFLDSVVQFGKAGVKHSGRNISPLFFVRGLSGYHFQYDQIKGDILFGLDLDGSGYILKRIIYNSKNNIERYDYFNQKGEWSFKSETENIQSIIVDTYEMDLSCPILNHLYNYLSLEYSKAKGGIANTKMIHSVEKMLQKMYVSDLYDLPIRNKFKDDAIKKIYDQIIKSEEDPVLSWRERQLVTQNHVKNLKHIIETKKRAHKLSSIQFNLLKLQKDIVSFIEKIVLRPWDNLQGFFLKYTFYKIIWFFQTVRNNLGYSIALAVYGPFTYYFITMPMNPHAMQAVGKVRSIYLETKTSLANIIKSTDKNLALIQKNDAIAAVNEVTPFKKKTDEVEFKTEIYGNQNDMIQPSQVTTDRALAQKVYSKEGKTKFVRPKILGMLLSTDSATVNHTTWSNRMSSFKQMQIGYEENMEYASRMGRLEQIETQYNFPLQVEATWHEFESYKFAINKIRENEINLSQNMKQFLLNEIKRTHQLELYLWDRLGRFILDQKYVMLDADDEQIKNDNYVGRAFVFMEEMTNILNLRYQKIKAPKGYEKIKELSHFYKNQRKELRNIKKNLKENSNLFKQQNIYSSNEFRKYMKRQWEILYLQNSKAEEASNLGLNMYNWSIRNTIWILQSIYSAKKEELSLLVGRDLSPSEILKKSNISHFYENLVHNLTLEYVGIREELKNHLDKDIESTQRMIVLENLNEFIADREKLDRVKNVTNQNTAGTKL